MTGIIEAAAALFCLAVLLVAMLATGLDALDPDDDDDGDRPRGGSARSAGSSAT